MKNKTKTIFRGNHEISVQCQSISTNVIAYDFFFRAISFLLEANKK